MRQNLVVKTTRYKKHPVQISKALHVLNPYYGIKPQYQRAEVIPGGDCETFSLWESEDGTQFEIVAKGPRVGIQSLELEQLTAACDKSIYLLLTQPVDLRWARYVGMWYRAGGGDVFTPDDIDFYIFTREGNYLYANRAMHLDFFEEAYTDEGRSIWRYMELDLARFTRATGYGAEDLSEVWGVGFYSKGGVNGNVLRFDQIEFYTHGTGYGPARGNIISVPLRDDVHAVKGYAMAWAETAGRVDAAIDNEPNFAGICVDNPSQTSLAVDVTISAVPTTITIVDASLFEIGTCTIWDDAPNDEVLTITAVNRVTNEITVAATVAAYTIANNARLAMIGNEVGSIRVDIVESGIVNMLCEDDSIIAAGIGVSLSEAGAAPQIDNGGASSQGIMIGKSTEGGGATELIPILLGMPGTSGS